MNIGEIKNGILAKYPPVESLVLAKYPPVESLGLWKRFLGAARDVSECSETYSSTPDPRVPETYSVRFVIARYEGKEYFKYWGSRRKSEDLPPPWLIAIGVAVGLVAWGGVVAAFVGGAR